MKDSREDVAGHAARPLHWDRIAIAVLTAVVVVAGAELASALSAHMMNAIALVGSWMMLVLVFGYLTVRFRPSVGAPVLIGFGIGAVVVGVFAGMGMMA